MTQIWSNVNIGPHVHAAADITSGTIAAARLPNLSGLLHNVTATVPPTSAADSSAGYAVGSLWHDRTSDLLWQCASASVGAAVWAPLNQQLAVAVSGQGFRGPQATATAYSFAEGQINVVPWLVPPSGIALTDLTGEVTVAGSAGAVARMVVIADSGEFWPKTTVFDSGPIAVDTAAVKTVTASIQVPGPVAWVGIVQQGAPATRATWRAFSQGLGYAMSASPASYLLTNPQLVSLVRWGVTGAVPATHSKANWSGGGAGPNLVGTVA